MELSLFNYFLPEDRIAKHPAVPRDHSRLFVIDQENKKKSHCYFYEIEQYLKPGDLLVINNTKVIPARLFAKDNKDRTIEVLLLKSLSPEFTKWECLCKPGKHATKSPLTFSEGVVGFISRTNEDEFHIEFQIPKSVIFYEWLEKEGRLPLPPYLKRAAQDSDKNDYQTVFAKHPGSVAAPTAGLHFTPELIKHLESKGVAFAEITLEVSYGTFSPIRTAHIEDHQIHSEKFLVPSQVQLQINETKKNGGRVIAVGTTSLRALESLRDFSGKQETKLYITPGYQFKIIDGLITNFHVPESSLLVLVSALMGREEMMKCYEEAINLNYRFLSFGDAMLILGLSKTPSVAERTQS
jgi:S-adenosylmethionine:tRNA ribosyltransferase-isomerase